MESKKGIETDLTDFEYEDTILFLGSVYRVKYRKFAGLMTVEEQYKYSWFKSWSTGCSHGWKTIWFGHAEPLKKFIEVYEKGVKLAKQLRQEQ